MISINQIPSIEINSSSIRRPTSIDSEYVPPPFSFEVPLVHDWNVIYTGSQDAMNNQHKIVRQDVDMIPKIKYKLDPIRNPNGIMRSDGAKPSMPIGVAPDYKILPYKYYTQLMNKQFEEKPAPYIDGQFMNHENELLWGNPSHANNQNFGPGSMFVPLPTRKNIKDFDERI